MTLSRIFRPSLFIIAAGLLIAAVLWHVRMNFPFDDTYITFRYAYNLAHGYGIVWNPGGPHTEGYTNFLYVLLLTPFSALGWDLVLVSQIVNVIAVIVTAIAVSRITNSELLITSGNADDGPLRNSQFVIRNFLAPALLLLDPFSWFNAFSGMETTLFAMFIVFACGACVNLHQAQAKACVTPYIFATLATLTRPEGALLGAIIFIISLAQDRRNAKFVIRNFLLYFALPLVLYAIWKFWYFGDLLPNSFYVKVAQAGQHFPGRGSMRIYYEHVCYLVLVAGYGVWAVGYGRRKRISNSQGISSYSPNPLPSTLTYTLAIWCGALSIFYLFSVLIMNIYDRFMYSVEVSLIVLASVAVSRIPRRGIAWTLSIGLIVLQIFFSLKYRGGWWTLNEPVGPDDYAPLARTLESVPHHEEITLCWSDAGYLPYYTHMQHLDPVGLNTTAIAHSKTWHEVDRIIANARPALIFVPYYTNSDTIFHDAHGLINKGYPKLMQQRELASYTRIAVYSYPFYDIWIFADTLSAHYGDIRDAFRRSVQ